jgi:hypothetical protein
MAGGHGVAGQKLPDRRDRPALATVLPVATGAERAG